MRRLLISFSVLSSFLVTLPGQQAGLSGPIEGFIFDAPTGSFRPVIGLPGSASLGPAVLSGFNHGSVAPQKEYGLAFQDGQSGVLVSGLSSAAPSQSAVSGVIAGQEGVAWAGDGSLAVLFSRSGNWMQTLAGLPNTPTAGALTDLSSLGGSLTSIAVDARGKQIAVGMAGDGGGVYLISNGGAPVAVLAGAKPVAVAFSDDGSALYVLDGAALGVTAVSLSGLAAQAFSLDGMLDPVAIKATSDAAGGQVLYVAGRNDRLLRTYDASSFQILSETPLDFLPLEIRDFSRDSFLLAPRSSNSGSLWLLRNVPQQTVYFVPSASVGVGGAQ